jgi:hypothetical protein
MEAMRAGLFSLFRVLMMTEHKKHENRMSRPAKKTRKTVHNKGPSTIE